MKLSGGAALRDRPFMPGCARGSFHGKSNWELAPLGGVRAILIGGLSSVLLWMVMGMHRVLDPVPFLYLAEYLTKTPECYLATDDQQDLLKICVNLQVEHVSGDGPHIVENKNPLYLPQSRHDRRRVRLRAERFARAVDWAFASDWPLTVAMTINWTALRYAGEHNWGHALGMADWGREKYTRKELARCRPKVNGVQIPFVAIWGREVGARLGLHTHYALFWPSKDILLLVHLLVRITGSSAAFIRPPYAGGEVSRSTCYGWQIKMISALDQRTAAHGWVDYIANQAVQSNSQKRIAGNAFGMSKALSERGILRWGFSAEALLKS